MNKNYYPTQKTFVKYDDEHFLLYLNEEIVEDYLPENAEDGAVPFTAYAYWGTEPDGSTKIKATEATYAEFAAGLIRNSYTLDQELALHRQKDVKTVEFGAYFEYCEDCKNLAKQLLA